MITPKEYTSSEAFDDYDIVLFDEFHRAYDNVFEKAKAAVEKNGKTAIFSYDFAQSLARSEVTRNRRWDLEEIKGMVVFALSEKIRTNKEIADFIKLLLQPSKNAALAPRAFDNITVLFSKDRETTSQIIDEYALKGYQFINHSVSLRVKDEFDDLNGKCLFNSHTAIGLEFDKVIVVINHFFKYADGNLVAAEHVYRDYLYTKLLYEEMTRAREKLCVIVEDNYPLFENCECQRKSEPSANQYLSHLCERILEPPTPKVTANT